MNQATQINPYYETPEFKESFIRLAKISREHYESGLEKGQNLEGLAEDLYSEVGHYIYELLQNAEDACATIVKFTLKNESLEFSHNGIKYFTFEDIKAITTHGGGTKSKDSTKIGRFGIGFKSTSRITERPLVQSNQFAFQIINQVIPEQVAVDNYEVVSNFATRFQFPFGTKKLQPNYIFKETLSTLLDLDSQNLLFLNSIGTIIIEYFDRVPKKRVLGKKQLSNNLVQLRASLDGTKESVDSEYYLRFSKGIDANELENWARRSNLEVEKKNGNLTVAIAIKVEVNSESKDLFPISMIPNDRSSLFVFFPAKKEVTGLKFHIHAPFAATTTRESIKDGSPINTFLFEQLSKFMPEVAQELVSKKILNDRDLAVFPNDSDDLRPELALMRSKIYEFFREKKNRIPFGEGEYVQLEKIREVSNEIANLFTNEDLNFINGFNYSLSSDDEPIKFLKRSSNPRAAKFLNSVGIISYGLRDLVISFSYINSEYAHSGTTRYNSFEDWFMKFDFERTKSFYALLSTFDLSRIGVYFNKTPIIRVTDSAKPLMRPENAFISKSGEKKGGKFVHPLVFDFSSGLSLSNKESQVWRFLEAVGVKQYSKAMLLNDQIASYREKLISQEVSELVPDDSIAQALKELLDFAHGDVELERALSRERIFLSESSSGSLSWESAFSLYLDEPFRPASGFDSVMPHLEITFRRKPFWSGYSKIPKIELMMERLGAAVKISPISYGNGSNEEWTIHEFEKYLEHASPILRRNIWNYVKSATANRDRHYLRFPNRFTSNTGDLSAIAYKLKGTAWIPDKKGNLKKPSQIDQASLDEHFLYEKCDFLTAIGFGADSAAAIKERQEKLLVKQRKDEAAQLFGVDNSDDIDNLVKAMKQNPEKVKQLLAELNRPDLRDHIADPLALGDKVRSDTSSMPDIRMEEHTIFEREGSSELTKARKSFLTSLYLQNKIVVCQICSASSFIKTTNGDPYFEAIMVMPKFSKNSIYNVMALCGQCSAKFKWGKQTPDAEIMREILARNDYSGSVKIDVTLGGVVQQITFIESHFVALKGALKILE
jgi:hypothetical protein